MSEVKKYECTVLIDASCGVTVEASSPEEAAELAENAAAEQGAGSLCHQCSSHTECGDSYAVIVYDGDKEVLDTDHRSKLLATAQSELAALREELAACESQKSSWAQRAKTLGSQADDLAGRLTNTEQRLANAERRNAALEKDLGKIQSLARRTLWLAFCWNDHNFREAHTYAQTAAELSGIKSFEEANKFIESWTQPTESGASEYLESCKVAHESLKMENQRIIPARFKCLACGDYHEGSGNLPCPKMRPMSGASE